MLSTNPDQLTILQDNIFYCIAGYIVRSLKGKVACNSSEGELLVSSAELHPDHSYAGQYEQHHSLVTCINNPSQCFKEL